jgi:hypothetical protein
LCAHLSRHALHPLLRVSHKHSGKVDVLHHAAKTSWLMNEKMDVKTIVSQKLKVKIYFQKIRKQIPFITWPRTVPRKP